MNRFAREFRQRGARHGSSKAPRCSAQFFSATISRTGQGATASRMQGADLMTGERTVPPTAEDIDPSRLTIERTNAPKTPLPASQLVFGKTFTDHMLTIPWSSSAGWSAPSIRPYGPLPLDPAATVLHYAPTIFEGLKAYKGQDGKIRLFRPDKNWERMNRSAKRLAFPGFDGEAMTTLLKELVRLDAHWAPSEPGYSLYCRPTAIGTTPDLGHGASSEVLWYIIISPCGPYYATGFKPVKLLATTKYARSWPGGTGSIKIGSNYTSGVMPAMEAAASGYQQILWLFGDNHEISEVGTMNVFLALEKDDGRTELVTPPLNDTILPGVTRDSILHLARAHVSGSLPPVEGFPAPDKLVVSERKVVMDEVVTAAAKGKLKEVFGAGTAAVVCPVEMIGYQEKQINVPTGEGGLGPITKACHREIVGRQTGAIPSDWAVLVDP